MNKYSILSYSLNETFRRQFMTPQRKSNQCHQSTITLRILRFLFCPFSTQVSLMNFHITSLGYRISDSISHINRLRQKPVSHLLGNQIYIQFSVSSNQTLTNRKIKLRVVSRLTWLKMVFNSSRNIKSLFDFLFGHIFIELKKCPNNVSQYPTPQSSQNSILNIIFFLQMLHYFIYKQKAFSQIQSNNKQNIISNSNLNLKLYKNFQVSLMMDFLDKKIKSKRKIGTPTKKIKPNQKNNTIQNQFSDIQFPANLIFIRNISNVSNNQNCQLFQNKNKETSNFKISSFAMDQEQQNYGQDKQNDFNIQNVIQQQKEQIKLPSKLTKKQTLVEKNNSNQYDNILAQLSLSRNNSTFPITNLMNFQNQQIGQNIYLTQLLTLKSKISLTQVNNKNRQLLRNTKQQHKQDTQATQNRLQKDYEIKQTLGKLNVNKQGFICLNKLQKIFYFVKKIKLSNNRHKQQFQQNQIYSNYQDINGFLNSLNNLSKSKKEISNQQIIQQISQQIKLYNMDQEGYFVRFYKEWIQNNNIFIIYELGSYSIMDKNITNQKLPENQIWSILYDVSSALKWIYDNEKVHLNIKPGNVIKCRSKYKLMDPFVDLNKFQKELSALTESNSMESLNSSFYLAPQIIQFKGYLDGIQFSKCQVYSLGLSILQNITSMPANMKSKSMKQIKKYFKKQLHGYSSCLKKLLLRMIQTNFKKRPTLQELLSRNLDDNQNSNMKIKNQIKFKRSNSV